ASCRRGPIPKGRRDASAPQRATGVELDAALAAGQEVQSHCAASLAAPKSRCMPATTSRPLETAPLIIAFGDAGGIGPEVALKAIAAELAADDTQYLLIGDPALA